jgi:hypothetical protein
LKYPLLIIGEFSSHDLIRFTGPVMSPDTCVFAMIPGPTLIAGLSTHRFPDASIESESE